MKRILLVAVLAAALVAAWMLSRGGANGAPSVETTLARERAAAHFARGELEAAREALAPLVAVDAPDVEDLVRAAAIELAEHPSDEALPALERLRVADPENPALHYVLARRSLAAGRSEEALRHFRAVLSRAPDDLPAQLGIADALVDLGRMAEAGDSLRPIVALGFEGAGVWYVQAVYLMTKVAALEGRAPETQRYGDLFRQLTQLGYRRSTGVELDRGDLATVLPPRPSGTRAESPSEAPSFQAEPIVLPELGAARELLAEDLDGDGDVDFLAAGPRGVHAAFRQAEGYRVETVLAGPVDHVRAFDLGNDDSLDLVVGRGDELLLFEAASGADLLGLGERESSGRWSPSKLALPRLPSRVEDLAFVDFDHDGDLDLLCVGAFGARLLRNDGAAERRDASGAVTRGGFTDATREAGLPEDVALTWCATEDFDGDQDVDLLLGGPEALFLMDDRREDGFVDVAPAFFGGAQGMARAPLLADFDGDARPDAFEPGAPAVLWQQRRDGSAAERRTAWTIPEGARPIAVDLDLDGTLDVLWPGASGLADGALAFGLDVERAFALPGAPDPRAPLVTCDVDGDRDLDLVRGVEQGLEVLRCEGPVGNAARLSPVGTKDNRRAVGAVVEVRCGGLYRRIYWRGGAQLVGCGPRESLDVVRTTWPNGAVQTTLDVPAGDHPILDVGPGSLEQSESLVGSCPFLYSWNGTTYAFVTDVLGGTPLGLPMAPGVLLPPDHDEFVLVRGDRLAARNGRLELQLTEELREVTYLDRARLDVVDHPADAAVFPNERFTFPPFPVPHVHTVRDALVPVSATGSDGADWTAALAAEDGVHAAPFEPLEPQFLGLATPHWLELRFDPERVRDAARLRLVCTGWFYWTDASVNVASARTPGVEFVPPILQVPGPGGTWTDAGPPIGFPAGKSKTMVVDVSGVLDRGDPRLRIRSTLRLYWDRIRLAVDPDDAPLRVTALEPDSAELWPRGFSRPIEPRGADQPERFDWDRLTEHRRWNQHPGSYTRYGDAAALLHEVDDRYVILGSGDALTLRFDPAPLPPLADGWTRDYLLYLDGWAKDRDPNTVQALAVEPLPFHGMSAYPYRADERFPDDEAHRAWRAEWNTRPARRWIPPLSPRGEAEWALGRDPR